MGNLGIDCISWNFPCGILADNSGPYKSSITIQETIFNGNKGIEAMRMIADHHGLLRRTLIDVKEN